MLADSLAEGQVVENTAGDTPELKLPVQLAGPSAVEREGFLPSVSLPHKTSHMLSDVCVLLLLVIS